MSQEQDLKRAHELDTTEKPGEALWQDPLADTSGLISQDVPPGVDRRHFLIRSAVGGAAAVMMGRTVSAEERTAMAVATMPPQAAGSAPPLSADLDVVKKVEGPGADDRGRVLQGGPGPFQLAHDWPDAHHLRFLPASHQAAGRQARHGDEASGEPVRKPQRDRQGTRHGTRRARRTGREGTGDGRPEIPGRPARQARPGVPGEARRQVDRREPQGRHLRRHQGRLQAPEHDDGASSSPATTCCSSRSTTRWAADSSSGKGIRRRRRTRRSTRSRR